MSPSQAAHLRVAVADDERDTRQFFQEVLTALGHDVVATAATGRELVEQCRATAPDLVLTDVKMPDMDGLEAAAALNRDRPVPVIVVSAYADADLLGRASDGPVMTYLVKPVKPADLQAALTLAVARFEQVRQAHQEAADLRQTLEARKVIERAKGLVMRRLRVDEAEAFGRMRKLASIQNRKLVDISQAIVSADRIFQDLENNGPPTNHRNG